MPSKPKRPCSVPGCPALVDKGPCPAHAKAQRQHQQRYYTGPGVNYGRRWKACRAIYLDKHPLCVDCTAEGRTGLANEVDHVIPHHGDPTLFWDETNWAPRCKTHHSRKTASETWHRTA